MALTDKCRSLYSKINNEMIYTLMQKPTNPVLHDHSGVGAVAVSGGPHCGFLFFLLVLSESAVKPSEMVKECCTVIFLINAICCAEIKRSRAEEIK